MDSRWTRSGRPRRLVTRRGVPVHRAVASVQRAKAPLDMTGGSLPTTPSDISDDLPSTHDVSDDEENSDHSGKTTPMYVPEDDPLKHDPTMGHVDRESDDQHGDERVPGIEPPDAAPTPADLQSSPPERQPPDAAPVPGHEDAKDDQPILYQPMDK